MACIAKRRGRYVIDFYDNQGKRRWKTLPKDARKKDANKALREIEDLLEKGIYLPDKRIPTFKTLGADWLQQKKPNIRESTWEMYERHLKLHFGEIDNLKINRITIATVEKFISKRQRDSMNINTLRKLIVTFNQVLNYAVRRRLIDYNPVRDAERPKGLGIEEKEIVSVLTPYEIKAFLNEVKEHKYRVLFMLAIMSGVRRGELLGLKWDAVDWKNNQIRIKRTFNSGKWYQPKTKASNRSIDIGPSMMMELRKWKLVCPVSKLNLVFPNEQGEPIEPTYLRREHFYPALKAAGAKQIRFHDLRHTYASILIKQGENLKYIQSQLGHANPSVTLNTYSHLLESVNQEAACRLENTILETSGSKMVANVPAGQ
jgi:integrase